MGLIMKIIIIIHAFIASNIVRLTDYINNVFVALLNRHARLCKVKNSARIFRLMIKIINHVSFFVEVKY